MHPEHDFGRLLRQLRVASDLTQEALAEAVGCASQTVRALESGRRRPSREMVARLADILRVPAGERDGFVKLARAANKPLGATPAEQPAEPRAQSGAAPSAGRLPQPATPLIGRHHDLQRLERALLDERQRLVTLLGPGGVGKTRLAHQVAANLAPAFPDGAAFVALAAVADAAGFVTAIAGAVGCPLAGAPDAAAALLACLRERAMLLVLDNLEQLLVAEQGDQVAELLAAIHQAAPAAAVLVTSRERLRLQAEWVVELGGLAVPPDDQPASVARSDAVLLFVERARRTTGDFALGAHNQASVAQICRRLDGLPLALELAAAQVSFLPPPTLLARLDHALPLLEGGARDLPARQRTMRAAIGWSHNLLRPDERLLFQRLGALVGGFSLAAAEAVGAGDDIAPDQVLGLLRRLADQSLVVRDSGDEVRYRLLEPVRQYALEQLEARPAEAAGARRRHAAFFQALAEAAYPRLRGPEQVRWAERLEREYANLHAAMAWLLTQGDVAGAAHYAYALWLFLWLRGHFRAGQRWAEQLMALLPPAKTLARAHAALVGGVLAYGQAEHARAAPLADEALAAYRAIDYAEGIAYSLAMVGLIAAGLGQRERAVQHMAEAVARHLAIGDASNKWSAAMTLTYWAPIPLQQGNYAEAAQLARRALALARELGDRIGAYSALSTLALVGQAGGDLPAARRHFGEALALAVELRDVGNIAACLNGLGGVAAAQGLGLRAVRLHAAVEALLATHEAARYAYAIGGNQVAGAVAALRARLDPAAFAAAWAEGQAMSIDQAVAYALAATDDGSTP